MNDWRMLKNWTNTVLALSMLVPSGCVGELDPSREDAYAAGTTIATAGTYFYFRCNSTGWGVTAANQMVSTTPGVYSVAYTITTVDDPCTLTQTNALDGWGTQQNYYGFAASQTVVTAPSSWTLAKETSSHVDPLFRVEYPGPGSYVATFDTGTGKLTIGAPGGAGGGGLGAIKRVLLMSVDGLHAMDLYDWVAAHPRSAIAGLYAHGIEYANARATTPSNGFPAMLALATGGTPKTTGVYYDDSYDRTLFAPGSNCKGPPGTEVVYTGAVDRDMTQLFGPIDPANLPLALGRTNQCDPVFPHAFLKVNTIFEVIEATGAQTAWADSHPSYEILGGPSGTGVSDLYTPEVSSLVANGGSVDGVALAASLGACDGVTNSRAVTTDYTTCVPAAMAYDDVKVQAVVHEIDGLRSDGITKAPVPALFGMNFEAAGVAQTLPAGGYLDALAAPSALLEAALLHVDESIGRILSELAKKGLTSSTLVILTAKHGQAPIDGSRLRTLPTGRADVGLTSPLRFVRETVPTVDAVWASFVNPNTGSRPAVGGHLQLDDVGLLWLQTADETNFNVSSVVGALNDPSNAALLGADQLPDGSIFSTNVPSGSELAATFGDPQSADALAAARAPNVFIQPNLGAVYTTNAEQIAAHGGGSDDDTHVPLLLSNPAIAPLSVFDPVATTRVAVTILQALRIDPRKLAAVGVEGTMSLPGVSF